MGNLKTILYRGLFFAAIILLSARVTASDDFSQYGLGADGLTLPNKMSNKKSNKKSNEIRPPEKLSNVQFKNDFESDYRKYSIGQITDQQKQQNLNGPALKLDFEYQDETADFSSPFHGINADLNNKLNNSSNEYQTRMGYQFKHLTPEASFNYSPDSYGFGEYYNYGLGVAVPIKDIFSLETRYGWNKFDKQPHQGGMSDYQDWSVGVFTTYKGLKLKVNYIDMNASENSRECEKIMPCESKTVFSIIKNF